MGSWGDVVLAKDSGDVGIGVQGGEEIDRRSLRSPARPGAAAADRHAGVVQRPQDLVDVRAQAGGDLRRGPPLLLIEIADSVEVEAAAVLACCPGADRDARLAEPPPNDRGGPVVPRDPLARQALVEVQPAQLVGGRRRRRAGMRRWDHRTGHAELEAASLDPRGRDPETVADLGVVEPKGDVKIGQGGGVDVQARDASAAGRPQGDAVPVQGGCHPGGAASDLRGYLSGAQPLVGVELTKLLLVQRRQGRATARVSRRAKLNTGGKQAGAGPVVGAAQKSGDLRQRPLLVDVKLPQHGRVKLGWAPPPAFDQHPGPAELIGDRCRRKTSPGRDLGDSETFLDPPSGPLVKVSAKHRRPAARTDRAARHHQPSSYPVRATAENQPTATMLRPSSR